MKSTFRDKADSLASAPSPPLSSLPLPPPQHFSLTRRLEAVVGRRSSNEASFDAWYRTNRHSQASWLCATNVNVFPWKKHVEGMRGNVGFLCPVDQREKERENSIHLVKLLTILKMLNAVIYIYTYNRCWIIINRLLFDSNLIKISMCVCVVF